MKKLVGYAVYLIGCLLFLEIILRICFPIPELSNFNRINYQILDRVDNSTGYLRNINMIWKSSLDTNYSFTHELNYYGYRDEKNWKIEKEEGVKRVMMIGDSFVEGMMSTQEKTIPSGFEASAAKENPNQKLEVFNCGMMGIGLNEYVKFVKDAIPIFRPDEVILVLYSNDAPFQREYQPTTVLNPKKNNFWKPRLIEIVKRISANDPIPFAFAPEKRPFYKAVPDPGNPWTKNSTELSKQVTPKIAQAMKKGDFNYFRTNWILEEEKFLQAPISVFPQLNFIKNYLEQYDVNLTVFYIPSRSQVSTYYYQFERQACLQKCPESLDLTGLKYQQHAKILTRNCSQLGIPFHDLTALIKAKEENGEHLYWNYDDHMRGDSYRLLGNKIYQLWKK